MLSAVCYERQSLGWGECESVASTLYSHIPRCVYDRSRKKCIVYTVFQHCCKLQCVDHEFVTVSLCELFARLCCAFFSWFCIRVKAVVCIVWEDGEHKELPESTVFSCFWAGLLFRGGAETAFCCVWYWQQDSAGVWRWFPRPDRVHAWRGIVSFCSCLFTVLVRLPVIDICHVSCGLMVGQWW